MCNFLFGTNLKFYKMCRPCQKLHKLWQISNCQVNNRENHVFHSQTRVFSGFAMYFAFFSIAYWTIWVLIGNQGSWGGTRHVVNYLKFSILDCWLLLYCSTGSKMVGSCSLHWMARSCKCKMLHGVVLCSPSVVQYYRKKMFLLMNSPSASS